jgi:hypothetical protein
MIQPRENIPKLRLRVIPTTSSLSQNRIRSTPKVDVSKNAAIKMQECYWISLLSIESIKNSGTLEVSHWTDVCHVSIYKNAQYSRKMGSIH